MVTGTKRKSPLAASRRASPFKHPPPASQAGAFRKKGLKPQTLPGYQQRCRTTERTTVGARTTTAGRLMTNEPPMVVAGPSDRVGNECPHLFVLITLM